MFYREPCKIMQSYSKKWRYASCKSRMVSVDGRKAALNKCENFFRKSLGVSDAKIIQRLVSASGTECLKKGDCAVEAGEVQTQLFFLVSGIVRGYVIDENGRDITDCFASQPGDALMGCSDLNEPSQIHIEALTDCELIRVPMAVLTDLLERSPTALQMYSKLLMESLKRHWEMKRILYQGAMQRYQWFLTAYPGLINSVSNKHIASFLGITPVTLSRLRRQLREEQKQIV